MFSSLYSKLAVVLTGLFCLVGVAVTGVAFFSTEMYQQEVAQQLNRQLAAHIVDEKLLMTEKEVNQEALKEIFHMLMVINPSIEIYLLDPQGNILNFSAAPGKVKRQKVNLVPVKQWLNGDQTKPVLGDDPRSFQGQKVFSAARIPAAGDLHGYLYVILGGEIYDTIVQKLKGSYIIRLSAWIILASLLFALIAGLVLFATLTRRLRELTHRMEAFRHERAMTSPLIPRKRNEERADEIGRLTETFQAMAARIEDQIGQIERADALRRELIANVSHDLRTPLATLRGYIETLLLKEAHLTPDERRTYLETAIRHCERLSKLVSDLFELAKLDSDDMGIVRESFNLSELAHDVVQKFALKAKAQQIQLNTKIQGDPPFVQADIGLIERVLENLIENALHYTPAGGQVTLVVAPRSAEVMVEVRDTGLGIAKDQLAHIFERFYRIDTSRGNEPGHSGLGLAITKRILELHDRTIEVASALNNGTVFSFTLPIHLPA